VTQTGLNIKQTCAPPIAEPTVSSQRTEGRVLEWQTDIGGNRSDFWESTANVFGLRVVDSGTTQRTSGPRSLVQQSILAVNEDFYSRSYRWRSTTTNSECLQHNSSSSEYAADICSRGQFYAQPVYFRLWVLARRSQSMSPTLDLFRCMLLCSCFAQFEYTIREHAGCLPLYRSIDL